MKDRWQIQPEPAADDERYRRFGLSRNPFSASGLAPENPAGQPLIGLRSELEDFVRDFIQTGSFQAAFLIGPYGSGKTHHMRLLEQAFRGFARCRVVYLASARNNPREVMQDVVRELGQGDLARLVWHPVLAEIRRLMADSQETLLEQLQDEKTRSRRPRNAVALFRDEVFAEKDLYDYRELVVAVQKRPDLSLKRLRAFAVTTLVSHLNINSGSAALLLDTSEDESIRAAGGAEALFTRSPRDQADDEVEVLRAVTSLLRADGSDRLVILIDEFEGVSMRERLTKRQSVEYLYSLRMLLDQTSTIPYALVVATTEEAFALARESYRAAEDRFGRQFRLPFLDKATAHEVLAGVLASARRPRARGGIRPFTEEFIDAALGVGIRSPRRLIGLAHRALEAAVDSGNLIIDAGLVTLHGE